ncbi:MAG: hypothetical protein U0556_06105 [Dehalococcoidia bacterium]
MQSDPTPAYLVEPADPFFLEATVVGQFRRQPFFCVRCSRREGPALHRDGALLLVGGRYFAVDFGCLAKLELISHGEVLTEGRARRVLPFVRFRMGPAMEPAAPSNEPTSAP